MQLRQSPPDPIHLLQSTKSPPDLPACHLPFRFTQNLNQKLETSPSVNCNHHISHHLQPRIANVLLIPHSLAPQFLHYTTSFQPTRTTSLHNTVPPTSPAISSLNHSLLLPQSLQQQPYTSAKRKLHLQLAHPIALQPPSPTTQNHHCHRSSFHYSTFTTATDRSPFNFASAPLHA